MLTTTRISKLDPEKYNCGEQTGAFPPFSKATPQVILMRTNTREASSWPKWRRRAEKKKKEKFFFKKGRTFG